MYYLYSDLNHINRITETEPERGQYTMLSPGYEDLRKLHEEFKILNCSCLVCGGVIYTTFVNRRRLVDKCMCFSCDLWDERSRNIKENNFIVDGCWYTVAQPTTAGSAFSGHGGSKFSFLQNARIIESRNVWFGGKIPERFRNVIKDNAVLL